MQGPEFSIPLLFASLALGYLLGALPLAERISHWHGVDIFTVGTGLAGASNVRRYVGRGPAIVVFLGDTAKGALAIIAARQVGVFGVWLVLPAGAVVVGHWNSAFTGFKGGDGLTTLGGTAVALMPVFGIASVAVALLVALGARRMPYTSLLSIVFGYGTLVALTLAYAGDTALAMGLGGLAAVVLAHAALGHARRRQVVSWEPTSDASAARARQG